MKAFITWFASTIPLIIFPALASGAYVLKAVCGEVMVGKPFELTCKITSGNVSKGINWFVSGNPNAIILCKLNGNCNDRDNPLYSTKNVQDNKQQFTIRKVQHDDLNKTWTCVDGLTVTSQGSSSCKLTDLYDNIKGKARYGAIVACIVQALGLGIYSVIMYCWYKDRLEMIRLYAIYCILEIIIISIVSGVATYFLLVNTRLLYGAAVGMNIPIFALASVIKFILLIRRKFSKCQNEYFDEDGSPASVPLK